MCTVTLVPQPGRPGAPTGIRLMCSRDESRDRPAALPPVEQAFNRTRAVFPVDAASGGTWVAVNDAGLIATLLNRNPADMRGVVFPGRLSRGGIIPSLLHAETLAQALESIDQIDSSSYPPFRLVLADIQSVVVAMGGAEAMVVQQQAITGPVMFTSSGLGDELVEGPRQQLFASTFSDARDTWSTLQNEFHHHQWEEHKELSVAMEREDAMTVSVTTIDLSAEGAVMTYHPAPPWMEAGGHRVHLPLSRTTRL